MQEIYRIFQFSQGSLHQIAFVWSESVKDFLDSCNKHNEEPNTVFFFAQKIFVEQ